MESHAALHLKYGARLRHPGLAPGSGDQVFSPRSGSSAELGAQRCAGKARPDSMGFAAGQAIRQRCKAMEISQLAALRDGKRAGDDHLRHAVPFPGAGDVCQHAEADVHADLKRDAQCDLQELCWEQGEHRRHHCERGSAECRRGPPRDAHRNHAVPHDRNKPCGYGLGLRHLEQSRHLRHLPGDQVGVFQVPERRAHRHRCLALREGEHVQICGRRAADASGNGKDGDALSLGSVSEEPASLLDVLPRGTWRGPHETSVFHLPGETVHAGLRRRDL
mmetsp:Transcript_17190/g.65619  ORF Transcript_17190/g.65619 Transcript_17190/m.65619 type:complete len:277 (-) Transcript_17190:1618-2448(-)